MKSTIPNRIRRTLSSTAPSARLFVAIALAGAIVSACDVHGGTNPGTVSTIVVTPSGPVVASSLQQMVAVGHDADGRVVTITPIWSIVAAGGTIDANGMFTAGATTGLYSNTVAATAGTISGHASITVVVPGAPTPIVNLATTAPNGIMAGTAVSCVTGGTINANVSVSPGNTVSGFGPCVITGTQHLGDATALQGQTDLTAAYNTLAGLACPPANAIVANLGGTTKHPGVYCTATGISVSGVLTLDGNGDPTSTFVFQAGSSITTAGSVVLINGAQAQNVYWVAASSATLGVSSVWKGNILAVQSITLVDNATLRGRALARNGAVSLGNNNSITLP